MLSESHKKAIGQGVKRYFERGGVSPMRGRHHSDETKKKMSESQIGKILSAEHKKKLSLARVGMKFSESHRRNLRLARTKDRIKFFKGTPTQYKTLHAWLKKHIVKDRCAHCGSLDKLQYANISESYLKHPNDYMVLCVKCHITYDWNKMREELARRD